MHHITRRLENLRVKKSRLLIDQVSDDGSRDVLETSVLCTDLTQLTAPQNFVGRKTSSHLSEKQKINGKYRNW
jgi:hypothetical protein